MFLYIGRFDRAVPELKRVIAMREVLEDQAPVGSCYRALGWLYLWSCRREQGLECLEKAKPILHRTGQRLAESFCLALIASEYGLLGRFEESLSVFDDAIRIAQECGARSTEAWERGLYRAQAPLTRGDWRLAIAMCDEAVELTRQIEDPWPGAWATAITGYASFMSGDKDGGLALALQAVRQVEALGALLGISVGFSWLAEMLCLAGRPDEAMAYAEQALAHMRLGSIGAVESRVYRARAMSGARRSPIEWESVDSDMEKSLTSARTLGYQPDLAVSHFRYAELFHTNGNFEEARQQLDQAVQLFIEMDMPWWIEEAAKLRIKLGPA
jgi:tetratricopeptide (TPR) repeat protein